jgi:DNA polymerase-3 subunit gamma/tau
MAFYHRYRPQTLSDLSGQDQVKLLLQQAFQNDKLSHAYLFVGPRGSGKTSTARILAKMVNCELAIKETSSEQPAVSNEIPCNQCSNCLSISDGSNLDLIEIDAASNRGIEDIRSLRETLKLTPTASPKKIYIIDEVHMLSNEAFNALLKTLEEPPAHVLFILATTEADKIPQTILSRSTRVDFAPGSISDITTMLQKIITDQKITIDDASLNQIAKLADGSFRDATKLLDQLASGSTAITLELINTTLRVSSFDTLFDLTTQLINRDTKSALASVSGLVEKSIPLRDFTSSLASFIRSLLMIKLGSQSADNSDFSEQDYAKLLQLSEGTSQEDLIALLNQLQITLEKMKSTAMPQLALELGIISVTSPQPAVRVALPEHAAPTITKSVEPKVSSTETSAPPKPATGLSDGVLPQNMTVLQDKWTYVLETIRPHNFSLEAIMRAVKLVNAEHDVIIIEAPYAFHQRIIEMPKNRGLLEALFSDVLAMPTKIQVIVGERPEQSDIANIDLATDDEILKAAAEIFNSDPIES